MFNTRKKIKLLEQTQANLEATQDNLAKIQEGIRAITEKTAEQSGNAAENKEPLEVLLTRSPDPIIEKTAEEKRKAAYALNLCTVSVSQIVDYDDVRSLDQEYDNILNNLNLENMPKDEALLDILKQLMNVITFFKIQEGDKKMLEEDYRRKMKNAIWGAVPNLSVIVATPKPLAMVFSLATQVGIGYMNYRREQAEAKGENEKAKWKLKRAAMEQINALKRELFTTAWRLSDEYGFEDNYRLSERQIGQFNEILLDDVPVRRFERLLSVKENFEAYPPFWYYLGHSAAEYENKEAAAEYLKRFLELTDIDTKSNLLREDQLRASGALELVGLVEEKEERLRLLALAEQASGNANDVLQICAAVYFSMGEYEAAARLLRYLINEGYNVDVNANLIYRNYYLLIQNGRSEFRGKYESLKSRDDCELYMPEIPEYNDQQTRKLAEMAYIKKQRGELEKNIEYVCEHLKDKLYSDFREICLASGDITDPFLDFLQNIFAMLADILPEWVLKRKEDGICAYLETEREFIKEFLEKTEKHADDNTAESVYYEIWENRLAPKKTLENRIVNNEKALFEMMYKLQSFCTKNGMPAYVSINASYKDKRPESLKEKFENAVFDKAAAAEKRLNEKLYKLGTEIVYKYDKEGGIIIDPDKKGFGGKNPAVEFIMGNNNEYINRNMKHLKEIIRDTKTSSVSY